MLRFVKLIVHIAGITLYVELEEGCVAFFEDSCGFSRLPRSDNPSHAKKTNVKLLLVLSEQVDQKPRGEDDQHETIFHSVRTLKTTSNNRKSQICDFLLTTKVYLLHRKIATYGRMGIQNPGHRN